MKLIDLKTGLVIVWAYLLLGGAMGHTVSAINNTDWHIVNEVKEGFRLAFPGKPIEMTCQISPGHTNNDDSLKFYTLPTDSGTLILSVLHHHEIDSHVLSDETFKELMTRYLVNYLYDNPQDFENEQKYHGKLTKSLQGDQLAFKFTYKTAKVTQQLQGYAFKKGQTLYQLIYIAPKKNYDVQLLNKFAETFQFD